jgi:hypothetical protein
MPPRSKQHWLSSLAITLTVFVLLFAFWRIAPGATYLVALGALMCFVGTMWEAGKG